MFEIGDKIVHHTGHTGIVMGVWDNQIAAIKFDFPDEARKDVPLMVGAIQGGGLGGRLVLKGEGGWYHFDKIKLVEPEPAPIPPELVAFMFVNEMKPGMNGQAQGKPFVIGAMIELSWHASLEEAELRRIQLSNQNNNVHAYVRVD